MKKVLMLAAMLAMVFTAAAPAVAQDIDVSDDDFIDDDSTTSVQYEDNSSDDDQFCGPIITQYNAIAQGGTEVFAGGDAIAATANEAGVSNSAVVNCVNGDVNTVAVVEDGGDDAAEHPDYYYYYHEGDYSHEAASSEASATATATASASSEAASSESASASYSVLPDTGGASLIALGAGALLVAGGLLARRIVR